MWETKDTMDITSQTIFRITNTMYFFSLVFTVFTSDFVIKMFLLMLLTDNDQSHSPHLCLLWCHVLSIFILVLL